MNHYEQESDRYLLVNERGEIQDALPEVAILYDSEGGAIFKVGSPEVIRAKYLPRALVAFPDSRMITFRPPFPAAEINRASDVGSGYILHLIRRIEEGEFDGIATQPWQLPYGG